MGAENLDDITVYHVNQESDAVLRSIREEVFDKENRAVVAVTGPQGSGKTQRLLVTAAEAKERKAFVVYFDISSKAPWVLKGLAAAFEKGAKDRGFVKMLGAPAWVRAVGSIAKAKSGAYDPKEAGRRIGEALNAAAPSFLLLNDLHNLADTQEVDLFAKTLEQVATMIKPGVLVMISCYASYLAWLTANEPAIASRVNRVIQLATLSDDEARLVLAKKLLGKRIVEELEPTYPFDREAVVELNHAAHGNPRRLFELADTVLEKAVALRAYQIDAELVRASLPTRAMAPPSHPPIWQETETVGSSETAAGTRKDATPSARPPRRSFWGR